MADTTASAATPAGPGADRPGTEPERSPHGASIHGVRKWYAITGGIWLWMAHITAEAAMVNSACAEPRVRLVMHGTTVLTALATALAMYWSWGLYRAGAGSGEHERGAGGRDRFLGLVGLGIGAISLTLILWEGSYAFFLSSCTPL